MPKEKKILDQVRDVMRVRHYSIHTEKTYCDWIKKFVLFTGLEAVGGCGGVIAGDSLQAFHGAERKKGDLFERSESTLSRSGQFYNQASLLESRLLRSRSSQPPNSRSILSLFGPSLPPCKLE